MELLREIWLVKDRRKLTCTPLPISLKHDGGIDSQSIKQLLLDCVMEINDDMEIRVVTLEQENARLRNQKRQFYREQR